jgi:hypothetical protein
VSYTGKNRRIQKGHGEVGPRETGESCADSLNSGLRRSCQRNRLLGLIPWSFLSLSSHAASQRRDEVVQKAAEDAEAAAAVTAAMSRVRPLSLKNLLVACSPPASAYVACAPGL